jgi:hypothetical protein
MKRRSFLKASFTAGASFAAAEYLERLAAQPAFAGGSATTAAAGAGARPLFFVPERIAALRARIASNPVTQARWTRFLQGADALASGSRAGGGSETASWRLGLAWRVTGDERYAKKLRESLLNSVGAAAWGGQDVLNRVPPWHSSLGTASSLASGSVAREALTGFLTAEERQRVTEGMLRLGILPILEDWVLPEHRIHALDSMGHNWWSVCVSGAGLGVLALLGEDPRATDWLRQVEMALTGFFEYQGTVLQNKTVNFDPAGAFYEGVHYAGYGSELYLAFRLARTNALGPPPPIPVLERFAEFFAHTLYPTTNGDLAVDFGDSSLKPDTATTLRLLAALGLGTAAARWYLQRQDRDSIDPIALLYLDEPAAPAVNSLSPSIIYPAIGWATLRDSWADNATFLAVKSGFTWNHAHADAGSFVLYHGGMPLLIDSGKCAYSRPEYVGYYCQSKAHNVVLFNGQGQPEEDVHQRGVKFPGQVHDLLDDLGLKYVYADATGPMAPHFKRNYRHWLWLDGVILVFDDILAHEPGQFDWLLHYAGEAKVQGAAVDLVNGPAQARLTMLHPADPVSGEETGLVADAPDRKVKYLKFSTPTKSREQKFIVAIVPQPIGMATPSPKVELLKETDALGVRVTGAENLTEVYLNLQADGRRMHLNSNNVIGGWETDAYLTAFTRPAAAAPGVAGVTRYFISGGSYLRREGQGVFDSLTKATAVFQTGEKTQISILGQGHAEVSLLGIQKPGALRVNGRAATFSHDSGRHMIRFRADALAPAG